VIKEQRSMDREWTDLMEWLMQYWNDEEGCGTHVILTNSQANLLVEGETGEIDYDDNGDNVIVQLEIGGVFYPMPGWKFSRMRIRAGLPLLIFLDGTILGPADRVRDLLQSSP
jgi:hypothetical protein